ncbi:MAG: hypothetical protein EPO61_06170 [Nitrospirae bacterium]|nr:MAG: hypothetical protein EPO61_06170 [Nitrospirota bacterium]
MLWQTQAPVTDARPRRLRRASGSSTFCLLAFAILYLSSPSPAWAVTMATDPKGFEGIPWGAALAEAPTFPLTYSEDRIKEYQLKQEPLLIGTVPVQSMKFSTVDGKFARVTVRYQGALQHEAMLRYLQARYGPLDLTPGQTMAGANQQYNWRGPETEVNLTYDGKQETGVVFFESRALGAKFAEIMSGF